MNSLFLEAESFSQRGGWVVDPAAMGEMGSAYLMAHGAGVPVADAETSIEIPEAGEYHIWARTRDWTAVWKRGTPAGRFTIRISGYELPQVLGTNGEKWAWQKAGSLRLLAGEHTVALHDLTGFNGRCDALYFSTDPMDVPPDGGRGLEEFRKEKCAIVPVDDPGLRRPVWDSMFFFCRTVPFSGDATVPRSGFLSADARMSASIRISATRSGRSRRSI